MDLLEKASIILTPTAYNNGEALCVKPSDGSGDFDFSRNSAATRVNAQGLVEDVQILSSNLVQNGDFSEQGAEEVSNGSFSQQGSELVTNGDFATDSDWNKGTGWTISGGTANCDGVGVNSLQQSGVTTIGKTYKLTFDIIAKSGDNFLVISTNFGDTYVNGSSTSIGTNTFYITPTSGTGIRFRVANGTTLSIDNVSVVEVGQDWLFSGGAEVTEQGVRINNTITGANAYIRQSNSNFTIGKSFVLEYDVVATNGTTLAIEQASSIALNTSTIGNNKKLYFQWDRANTSLIIKRLTTGTDVTITNISVKEVGQNWINPDGAATFSNNSVTINGGSGNRRLGQSNVTSPITSQFKLQYEITEKVGTSDLKVYTTNSGSAAYTIVPSTIGVHTFYFTSNLTTFYFNFSNSSGTVTITNISVIEITDDTNLPRINYEGFSYQDALGSEEVVNGGFDTDSDWSLPNGADISNGLLNFDGSQTGAVNVNQNIPSIDLTKTYKVTFTISNYISGVVKVKMSNNAQGTNRNSNGTYTEYLSGMVNNALSISGNLNFNGSIDNVSVKEYLGQEVVPDSGCGSWLWENQSTNLITQSELFSDSSWVKSNTTIVSNVLTSPDGTINADNLKDTANNSIHRLRNGVALLANTDYTISVFAKKGTLSNLQVALLNTADSIISSRVFNLENGTLGEELTATGGTLQNSEIKDYGNGWYRCSITAQLTTTPNQAQLTLAPLSSGNTQTAKQVTYLGDGTGTVSIWGAQLEQQSYATSYIPTSGTSVTRNQDVCTNGGSVSTINSTEGVLYAEIAALSDSLNYRFITISDGTYNNRIYLNYTNISNQISVSILVGGVQSYGVTHNLSSSIVYNKIALKWKLNDFALWVNGVEVSTNNSNITFSPNTLNKINFINELGVAFPFLGKTKALAVWKEALSDEELTLLTTI